MKAYTNQAQIEAYLGITLDAKTVAQLPALINAVSIFIDNYTNNEFGAITEARRFSGTGCKYLMITAFSSITKIEVYDYNGDFEYEIPVADCEIMPQEKYPKFELILKANKDYSYFPKNLLNLKITGVYGVSEDGLTVPSDVQLAATMLMAEMIMSSQGQTPGLVKSEALGDYSISYDTSLIVNKAENNMAVNSILNAYKVYKL